MLRVCLRGIKKINPKLNYEVIVVDNASADRTETLMREQFTDHQFVQLDSNTGCSTGDNAGIKKAKGKYVFVLNPDIVIFEDAIEELHRFMEENNDVGIVAPQLQNPDRTLQKSCYAFPRPVTPLLRRTPIGKFGFAKAELDRYLMNDWDHQSTRDVDWMLGGCILARAEAISKVGYLDENYFMYFEDTDWCRRFWEAGWRVVYHPKSVMVHYHRRESADGNLFRQLSNKLTRVHIHSSIKYFKKYKNEENPRVNRVSEVSQQKLID